MRNWSLDRRERAVPLRATLAQLAEQVVPLRGQLSARLSHTHGRHRLDELGHQSGGVEILGMDGPETQASPRA